MFTFTGNYSIDSEKEKFTGELWRLNKAIYQGTLLQVGREPKEIFALRNQGSIDELYLAIPLNKAVLYLTKELSNTLQGEYGGQIHFFNTELPSMERIIELFPMNGEIKSISGGQSYLYLQEE